MHAYNGQAVWHWQQSKNECPRKTIEHTTVHLLYGITQSIKHEETNQ